MKTLREIPAVRALAEKEAREAHNATVAAIKDRHPGTAGQRMLDGLPPKWASVAAHLDLLCNLERPASRDAIARLIAEAAGLLPLGGTTATTLATSPDFGRYFCGEHSEGEDGDTYVACDRRVWILALGDRHAVVDYTFADCGQEGGERRLVPGISAVTDPAEALRLIVLAVLGGPRG